MSDELLGENYELWIEWLNNVIRPIDKAREWAVKNKNKFPLEIRDYRADLFDPTTLAQVLSDAKN